MTPQGHTISWSRRAVLRAGAIPLLGLGLPRLLAADPQRPTKEPGKHRAFSSTSTGA